jgi:pimeloyl-ACP methyl ester carboxylesterase
MKKETKYQQKTITYQVEGEGQPVFLLHGFGETAAIWQHQVTQLKDRYKLIVPDLPGSGESELIDDMSMEGMAETIHAIIHAEGIDTCTVIGHSMGGYITLALVQQYWNHVQAFGLFHSSAYADSAEKKEARKKGIAFIREHGAFEFLKTSTPNLYSPQSREERPELIDQHVQTLRNFSADALVLYYEAMMARPDTTSVLRKTTVPVLFIIGEKDAAVPPADTLQQSHLPEKAYIHILRQSGHMGMLEETKRSNLILEEFLLVV